MGIGIILDILEGRVAVRRFHGVSGDPAGAAAVHVPAQELIALGQVAALAVRAVQSRRLTVRDQTLAGVDQEVDTGAVGRAQVIRVIDDMDRVPVFLELGIEPQIGVRHREAGRVKGLGQRLVGKPAREAMAALARRGIGDRPVVQRCQIKNVGFTVRSILRRAIVEADLVLVAGVIDVDTCQILIFITGNLGIIFIFNPFIRLAGFLDDIIIRSETAELRGDGKSYSRREACRVRRCRRICPVQILGIVVQCHRCRANVTVSESDILVKNVFKRGGRIGI